MRASAHQAEGLLGWLDASALAQAMRGWLWLYPIIEILHIFGFAILVGAVVMFDLRVLGLSKHVAIKALGDHLLRWSVAALLLVVPAGIMMFSAHPQEFADSGVFRLKLLLICTAGLNALLFHAGVYRSVSAWNTEVAAPLTAKTHAVLSLMLWIAVISCGRLLAYT